MGWNYLSIPKLQRSKHWSLGMDKKFIPHTTLLGMWLLIHAGIRFNPCQLCSGSLRRRVICRYRRDYTSNTGPFLLWGRFLTAHFMIMSEMRENGDIHISNLRAWWPQCLRYECSKNQLNARQNQAIPLPEPLLLYRLWIAVALNWMHIPLTYNWYHSMNEIEIYIFKLTFTFRRVQRVNT